MSFLAQIVEAALTPLSKRLFKLLDIRLGQSGQVRLFLGNHSFASGVDSLADRIYSETEGYPLLIEMAIQEIGSDGPSVLALKKFYDRQTQWMSTRKRSWFEHLCYLDKIDRDTIPRVLPDENAQEVQEWFMTEGSIRDPRSSTWSVRPFVRHRVLGYFQSIWPSEFERLRTLAESGQRNSIGDWHDQTSSEIP